MSGLDLILLFGLLALTGYIGFVCGRAWEACVQTDREMDEWEREDRARLDAEDKQ